MITAFDTHVGAADEVIASLRADSHAGAGDRLVFQAHSVDAPHPHILRSIELVAEKVAPALGWTPDGSLTWLWRADRSEHDRVARG